MARTRRAYGFTLVELLVVISIIALLVAITVPAISAARESARMTACKHNQHQLWVGLSSQADRTGKFCSGAFSWRNDGAVTEIGWVADSVKQGILPGQLLCPSSPRHLSETYDDLMNLPDIATITAATCLPENSAKGSIGTTLPSGETLVNPCRKILDMPGMAVADRLALVQSQVYEQGFNTNYVASWFLVRSGPSLKDGQLNSNTACAASIGERHSTLGPLQRARAEVGRVPQNILPLLACGGRSGVGPMQHSIGRSAAGQELADSYTDGPVDPATMAAPAIPAMATYEGPSGWWAQWNATLQDYTDFAPVHRGQCNIVFADGSVRSFEDLNDDGFLNNGFTAAANNPFVDDTVELPPHEVFSRWELRTLQVP